MTSNDHAVILLAANIAQLKLVLAESRGPFEGLGDSFARTLVKINVISRELHAVDSEHQQQFESHMAEIGRYTNEAIIAFQFFDRLTQKLDHVIQSLDELGTCLNDGSEDERWQELAAKMRAHYTMEVERQLFDLVRAGITPEAALASLSGRPSADSSVEFF